LCVQVLLLMPVLMKKLTGSTAAVGWMFTLEACLSLSLLYPLARLGERYSRRETRMLIGLAFMTASWACLVFIHVALPAFMALGLLYLGTLIVEPAREAYVASLANPQARASYMGASRMGLALGGAVGYAGGGWLYDLGQKMAMPGLPWATLALIGAATWLTLYRQFFGVADGADATTAAALP
jgi:DHA1 family multidrug resistance protein-like MFS transporter